MPFTNHPKPNPKQPTGRGIKTNPPSQSSSHVPQSSSIVSEASLPHTNKPSYHPIATPAQLVRAFVQVLAYSPQRRSLMPLLPLLANNRGTDKKVCIVNESAQTPDRKDSILCQSVYLFIGRFPILPFRPRRYNNKQYLCRRFILPHVRVTNANCRIYSRQQNSVVLFLLNYSLTLSSL